MKALLRCSGKLMKLKDKTMKKLLSLAVLIAAAWLSQSGLLSGSDAPGRAPDTQVRQDRAPADERNSTSRTRNVYVGGAQIRGEGVVTRLLTDDNDGDRHQRFILRTTDGRSLLIAHNIDLAPRISALRDGDTVEFYGVFETNDRGGVVHWTHHDPAGRHVDGWLRHNGRLFQ